MDFFEDSKLKYLIIIVPIILVGILVALLIPRLLKPKTKSLPPNINLTYWGLFEEKKLLEPLILEFEEEFNNENPGTVLDIEYEERSYDSLELHRETALTRINSDTTPDMLRVHVSWLNQFAPQLAPLPEEIMTFEEYSSSFYRVAVENASFGGQAYGVPIMYEGLVLLVNDDHFAKAGLTIPKVEDNLTWLEFSELADRLTLKDKKTMVQAGAAIGLSSNIPHSTDILGLMMAQSGVTSLDQLDSKPASDALQLYTSFYTEDKVWGKEYLSSIDAFINGKVSMIFVPSWRIHDIQELNPGLTFSATAVPQIPSTTGRKVNWASFWVEVVNAHSEYPEISWNFLDFLASEESQKKMFALTREFRDFGEPYSRVALGKSLETHKYLGPLISGAPTAQTWFISDYSGNGSYVTPLKTAITNTAENGMPAEKALQEARLIIEQLAKQNGAID